MFVFVALVVGGGWLMVDEESFVGWGGFGFVGSSSESSSHEISSVCVVVAAHEVSTGCLSYVFVAREESCLVKTGNMKR